MNYKEMTGQESGIWIYRKPLDNPRGIICNWDSDTCSGCMPLVFDDGLVWMSMDITTTGDHWKKTGNEVNLSDWLYDVEIIYDANNNVEDEHWDYMLGDVYEHEDYVILAPKDWN
ncbi:MAG: hypothetical protein IJF84_00335 [Thermoguttaceae bacterium]|nr:hypothetical protein [Thermoguttaceae bacterium]